MHRKRLLIAAAAVSLLAASAAMADMTTTGPVPGKAATLADDGAAPAESGHRHLVNMRDPDFLKKMCVEHFARSAGRLAYLEAKLQLTAEQQPLWNKWAEAEATGSATLRDDCLAAVPAKDTPRTALDRDSQVEKLLSDKLDTLKTARPALEALYRSLTPEQRAAFDRGIRPGHGMGGQRWWRHHGQDGDQGEMSPT
jgi:LTXXQ motif family protein